MATLAGLFDFGEMYRRLYDFSIADGALDYQITVEEFMASVRTTPGVFQAVIERLAYSAHFLIKTRVAACSECGA